MHSTLVTSSPSGTTKSQPTDQTQHRPKMWGVIPKIESTSSKVDFGSHRKNNAEVTMAFPRRMIVMGGPARCKGTQCQAIAEKHGLVHFSTGDMLRQAVSSESSVDNERAPHISKNCMEKGLLIPDDIVVRLVLGRLRYPDCKRRGLILYGFPHI